MDQVADDKGDGEHDRQGGSVELGGDGQPQGGAEAKTVKEEAIVNEGGEAVPEGCSRWRSGWRARGGRRRLQDDENGAVEGQEDEEVRKRVNDEEVRLLDLEDGQSREGG